MVISFTYCVKAREIMTSVIIAEDSRHPGCVPYKVYLGVPDTLVVYPTP